MFINIYNIYWGYTKDDTRIVATHGRVFTDSSHSIKLIPISVQFLFSFNSYNFVFSISLVLYLYCFKDYLTLYKYNRTYFFVYVILLRYLRKFAFIDYSRDNRHGELHLLVS